MSEEKTVAFKLYEVLGSWFMVNGIRISIRDKTIDFDGSTVTKIVAEILGGFANDKHEPATVRVFIQLDKNEGEFNIVVGKENRSVHVIPLNPKTRVWRDICYIFDEWNANKEKLMSYYFDKEINN